MKDNCIIEQKNIHAESQHSSAPPAWPGRPPCIPSTTYQHPPSWPRYSTLYYNLLVSTSLHSLVLYSSVLALTSIFYLVFWFNIGRTFDSRPSSCPAYVLIPLSSSILSLLFIHALIHTHSLNCDSTPCIIRVLSSQVHGNRATFSCTLGINVAPSALRPVESIYMLSPCIKGEGQQLSERDKCLTTPATNAPTNNTLFIYISLHVWHFALKMTEIINQS